MKSEKTIRRPLLPPTRQQVPDEGASKVQKNGPVREIEPEKKKPEVGFEPGKLTKKDTSKSEVVTQVSSNLGYMVTEAPSRPGVTAADEARIREASTQWTQLSPDDRATRRERVWTALSEQRTTGSTLSTIDKLEQSGLSKEQQKLVLDTVAIASDYYDRVAGSTQDQVAQGTQAANKTHLFGEVDQLCDAAKKMKLDPHTLTLAMLSTTYSDMVKIGGKLKMAPEDSLASMRSLMNHDLSGAAAAEAFLALDPRVSPDDRAKVIDAIRAHQYTPPGFFAGMMATTIRFAMRLAGYSPSADDEKVMASLTKKIAAPYENLQPGTNRVALSKGEQRLMREWVGREDWVVPQSPQAQAVAAADVLDNYASPGGLLKYPRFRGPGTTFQDATLKDSLGTVYPKFERGEPVFDPAAYQGPPHDGRLPSCVDAYHQMPAPMRELMREKLKAALPVLEKSYEKMAELLQAQGLDPAQVPFWGKPLTTADYEDLKKLGDGSLTDPARVEQLNLALRVKGMFITAAQATIKAT